MGWKFCPNRLFSLIKMGTGHCAEWLSARVLKWHSVVYCEPEGKKPIHCTKCKSSMEVKSHFVNLKGYLHSKGELDPYNVDRTNSELCATFGVPMEEIGEEDGSATDSS